ncbi:hypothetical protein D3I60_15885 [Brevibacterium permense]|nr:hypothetical protein [Brevibacterium permense]
MNFSFELMDLIQCGTTAQHPTRSGSHILSEISEHFAEAAPPHVGSTSSGRIVRVLASEFRTDRLELGHRHLRSVPGPYLG